MFHRLRDERAIKILFWLWLALILGVAILFGSITMALLVRPAQAEVPIGYAGRPPTTHTPGHCWCRYHGPRGGCKQWVCRHG